MEINRIYNENNLDTMAKMPIRCHEIILIFYKELSVYNPQKTFGHRPVNKSTKKPTWSSPNYGEYKKIPSGDNTDRMPRSIIYENVINSAHDPIHPTQKPLDLIRYLIKTYSNEGDLVYDGYAGSGTTAAACIVEKRNWIISEISKKYCELSEKRIKPYLQQLSLL